jgi:hypothetical protein
MSTIAWKLPLKNEAQLDDFLSSLTRGALLGLLDPSFAKTSLARRGINPAAGLRRLLDRSKARATTGRTNGLCRSSI